MLKYLQPFMSVILAIAITATMDFTGYFEFSALPLLLITTLFCWISRLTKGDIGLKRGQLQHYLLALIYPLTVLGATALVSWIYEGGIQPQDTDWTKFLLNLTIGVFIGPLMLILTEEGFFRGWLWGALKKSGLNSTKTLILTSIVFMLWHISAVTSGTDYGLPLTQIPIYLINALLLGLIWGLLRMVSGSIIVASVSHAIWNPLAYGLFGFGEKTGALDISHPFLLGPEVGYLGIVLNGIYFIWLWRHTHAIRKSLD